MANIIQHPSFPYEPRHKRRRVLLPETRVSQNGPQEVKIAQANYFSHISSRCDISTAGACKQLVNMQNKVTNAMQELKYYPPNMC